MAANKRSGTQVEHDRRLASRLALRGWSQTEIAARLGVTQQQVSYDLAIVEKAWQEAAAADLAQEKARTLAKLDHLERTYWDAWEHSCGEQDAAPSEAYPGEADLAAAQQGRKKRGRVVTADPVPTYLGGVQWCLSERSKLYGHYAPTKQEIGGPGGGPQVVQVVYDDDASPGTADGASAPAPSSTADDYQGGTEV